MARAVGKLSRERDDVFVEARLDFGAEKWGLGDEDYPELVAVEVGRAVV